jgi:hypothetical protein
MKTLKRFLKRLENDLMEVGMFEDLRNSASHSFEEEPPEPKKKRTPRQPERLILGMTAAQRFVVALLLFIAVWIFGLLFLVVTDKVVISLPAILSWLGLG